VFLRLEQELDIVITRNPSKSIPKQMPASLSNPKVCSLIKKKTKDDDQWIIYEVIPHQTYKACHEIKDKHGMTTIINCVELGSQTGVDNFCSKRFAEGWKRVWNLR